MGNQYISGRAGLGFKNDCFGEKSWERVKGDTFDQSISYACM
jgi:hypothetical protein